MSGEKPLVLIVDDDVDLRETLQIILRKKFNVIQAGNATEGLHQAVTLRPSIVLLDINMAGEDGISLCKNLRGHPETTQIPIVMMTGMDGQSVRVSSFEAGADDFLPKPFSANELCARIDSKIRRAIESQQSPEGSGLLRFSDLEMELTSFSARLNGVQLELGLIEFRILCKLIQKAKSVVKRSALEEFIWGENPPQTRSLDTHISTLRRKLENSKVQLRTVYSEGYILE